jgi:predicted RNase H-like HicB family nuclease
MATTVRLSYAEGYGYSARHLSSGVASQGETEADALHALAEALTLHGRDEEHAVEPDAEWYDRFGVSPRR